MDEKFTMRFGLDSEPIRRARVELSPKDRERAFASRQITTLLRYVTLYEDGERLSPDSFAITNNPDRLLSIDDTDDGGSS